MEKHDIKIGKTEFSIFKDERVWGDGNHESTQFLMQLISKYGVKDKTVIDVGAGTGILSVLCGKLGAKHILAVDIDLYSLEWAKKNFKRNGVEAETEVNDMLTYLDDKADIILSNLPGNIQVESIRQARKNLNEDGLLIGSWLNELKFDDYITDYEVVEHIEGAVYDGYVLRRAKIDR